MANVAGGRNESLILGLREWGKRGKWQKSVSSRLQACGVGGGAFAFCGEHAIVRRESFAFPSHSTQNTIVPGDNASSIQLGLIAQQPVS